MTRVITFTILAKEQATDKDILSACIRLLENPTTLVTVIDPKTNRQVIGHINVASVD